MVWPILMYVGGFLWEGVLKPRIEEVQAILRRAYNVSRWLVIVVVVAFLGEIVELAARRTLATLIVTTIAVAVGGGLLQAWAKRNYGAWFALANISLGVLGRVAAPFNAWRLARGLAMDRRLQVTTIHQAHSEGSRAEESWHPAKELLLLAVVYCLTLSPSRKFLKEVLRGVSPMLPVLVLCALDLTAKYLLGAQQSVVTFSVLRQIAWTGLNAIWMLISSDVWLMLGVSYQLAQWAGANVTGVNKELWTTAGLETALALWKQEDVLISTWQAWCILCTRCVFLLLTCRIFYVPTLKLWKFASNAMFEDSDALGINDMQLAILAVAGVVAYLTAADIYEHASWVWQDTPNAKIWLAMGVDVDRQQQQLQRMYNTATSAANGAVAAVTTGVQTAAAYLFPARRKEVVFLSLGSQSIANNTKALENCATSIGKALQQTTNSAVTKLEAKDDFSSVKRGSSYFTLNDMVNLRILAQPSHLSCQTLRGWTRCASDVDYFGIVLVNAADIGNQDQQAWKELTALCSNRVFLIVSGYTNLLQTLGANDIEKNTPAYHEAIKQVQENMRDLVRNNLQHLPLLLPTQVFIADPAYPNVSLEHTQEMPTADADVRLQFGLHRVAAALRSFPQFRTE